jgi:ABC-type amino acid transport system permease subunit
MDSQMMHEALPQYIQAMLVTLKLASAGILLALIIGLGLKFLSFILKSLFFGNLPVLTPNYLATRLY